MKEIEERTGYKIFVKLNKNFLYFRTKIDSRPTNIFPRCLPYLGQGDALLLLRKVVI